MTLLYVRQQLIGEVAYALKVCLNIIPSVVEKLEERQRTALKRSCSVSYSPSPVFPSLASSSFTSLSTSTRICSVLFWCSLRTFGRKSCMCFRTSDMYYTVMYVAKIKKDQCVRRVFAFETLWSNFTSVNATPAQTQEVHKMSATGSLNTSRTTSPLTLAFSTVFCYAHSLHEFVLLFLLLLRRFFLLMCMLRWLQAR